MNNLKVLQDHYLRMLSKKIESKGGPRCASLDEIIENILFLGEKTEDTFYLSLQDKKMIAFLFAPQNRLEYRVERTETSVAVEALFYWEPEDVNPAGVGFVKMVNSQVDQELFVTDEIRNTKLEAIARGRAASRALYDAGIGMEFYGDIIAPEEYENSIAKAEAGSETEKTPPTTRIQVEASEPTKDIDVQPALPVPKRNKKKATAPTPQPYKEKYAAAGDNGGEESDTEPVEAEAHSPAPAADLAPTAGAEIALNDAYEAIADIGNHHGETLKDIYEKYPKNLVFLVNKGSNVRDEALAIIRSNPELSEYYNSTQDRK